MAALPAAVARTIFSKRNRSWDAVLANLLSAALVGPAVGFLALHWWGIDAAICSSGVAALIGVDFIRGLLKLGEVLARDPESAIKIWRGK